VPILKNDIQNNTLCWKVCVCVCSLLDELQSMYSGTNVFPPYLQLTLTLKWKLENALNLIYSMKYARVILGSLSHALSPKVAIFYSLSVLYWKPLLSINNFWGNLARIKRLDTELTKIWLNLNHQFIFKVFSLQWVIIYNDYDENFVIFSRGNIHLQNTTQLSFVTHYWRTW